MFKHKIVENTGRLWEKLTHNVDKNNLITLKLHSKKKTKIKQQQNKTPQRTKFVHSFQPFPIYSESMEPL